MMTKPCYFTCFSVAIACAVLGACGPSTTLEQAWTSPSAAAPPLQKVVTVFFSESETTRRAGEDRLAAELAAKGVEATPSYAIIPDKTQLGDLDQVRAQLLGMGYDGVVALRIVDAHQEVEYTPSTFDSYWGYAYPYFYSPSGYYGGYYPGSIYVETVVRVETTAYSLRTNQLVWSALSRTVDEDVDDLIEETSDLVAEQLTERGLAT
jgi:hypothetical protein